MAKTQEILSWVGSASTRDKRRLPLLNFPNNYTPHSPTSAYPPRWDGGRGPSPYLYTPPGIPQRYTVVPAHTPGQTGSRAIVGTVLFSGSGSLIVAGLISVCGALAECPCEWVMAGWALVLAM